MRGLDPNDQPILRLVAILIWLVVLIFVGTAGYCWIEGWCLSDAMYMSLITISTVGYGETQPLTESGRWFTGSLIFISLISMAIWTAILTSYIVERDLSGYFKEAKTRRMIAAMENHTVICGASQIALLVIERLSRQGTQLVLIDEDQDQLDSMKKRFRKLQVVCGSPVSELVLARANILLAKNVVAATESDLSNLLIGITCRDLGEHLNVIAESNDLGIANRMRKSGINEVISPFELGSQEIASCVLATPA